jgi:hypothetical protein
MPAINAQANNLIYPSTVGDRGLSTGVSSPAVNLNPNQADRFTKQSKQGNSLELESQSQSKVFPWVWAVGGLATLGVIGLAGWAWWKNRNPESAAKGATGAVNQFVTPHKDPNFTGIQPKRSYTEVEALCKQVMEVGNGGLACQTMSCINSIRLYKKLCETERNFDNSYIQNVKIFLRKQNNEELKRKSFEFFSTLLPSEYKSFLANNRINNQPKAGLKTLLMPHFLSQYVFNTRGGSTATIGGFNAPDMVTILTNLCDGNIGLLGGQGWRGGHMVSLVGIHEDQQGSIHTIIDQLTQQTSVDMGLLEKIKLLIYDQNSSTASVEGISLKEIFESQGRDKYFDLRVFAKQKLLNKPLEKEIGSQLGIASTGFHQNLMNTGNAVFNAT